LGAIGRLPRRAPFLPARGRAIRRGGGEMLWSARCTRAGTNEVAEAEQNQSRRGTRTAGCARMQRPHSSPAR
jgi:hypothetical protein